MSEPKKAAELSQTENTSASAAKKFDFRDMESYRLTEADKEALETKQVVTEIRTKRPHKQDWVRTHPEMVMETTLFKLEETGDFYLVAPDMRYNAELTDSVKPFRLQLAVTARGVPFMWPAVIPEDGGLGASWHRSGLAAQHQAETVWTRMQANKSASMYDIHEAKSNPNAPKWPEGDMGDFLELAFGDRVIDTPDHVIIKMLAGIE